MDIISGLGLELLLRWIHFLAGITWIGLLYYFNFVQGESKKLMLLQKRRQCKNLCPGHFGGLDGRLCLLSLQGH